MIAVPCFLILYEPNVCNGIKTSPLAFLARLLYAGACSVMSSTMR